MPQGTTINPGAYCTTPRKLRRALQNKRCAMLSKCVLLLHGNIKPYTSRMTPKLMESSSWEVFNHAPDSPDHAPGDFHIFRYLKYSLGGKRFSDNE
ncbi:histone-lysine N-methyltransferase SETMAR [Trichonephila clavipes]|nr:histone-lysine N-methyltransferase SETMAR [Trichonephila clavipes]